MSDRWLQLPDVQRDEPDRSELLELLRRRSARDLVTQ